MLRRPVCVPARARVRMRVCAYLCAHLHLRARALGVTIPDLGLPPSHSVGTDAIPAAHISFRVAACVDSRSGLMAFLSFIVGKVEVITEENIQAGGGNSHKLSQAVSDGSEGATTMGHRRRGTLTEAITI